MGLLDKAINIIAPKWGAARARAKAEIALADAQQVATRKFLSHRAANVSRVERPFNEPIYRSAVQQQGSYDTSEVGRIRARARWLDRNDAIANAIFNRAVENLVSDGYALQCTTDDAEWNALAEQLFFEWADRADIGGRSFLRMQRLWMRSFLRDGDIGVGLLSGARLQTFEGDVITSPTSRVEGKRVVDGVELNQYNRPKAYYVQVWNSEGKRDWDRFDQKDFILFQNETSFSEFRGYSVIQPAFHLFDHVSDWVEASIIAAKISACVAIAITKTNPAAATKQLATASNITGEMQKVQGWSPGSSIYLGPGEDVKVIDPAHPQQSFPDTVRALLRLLSMTVGMPLEMIGLDFSQANFSSSRAAMLQSQKTFQCIQQLFIESILSRIFRWWVSKAINGEVEGVELPAPAGGNEWSHRWIAPEWAYIDPVKELQAQQLAIDCNFSTLTEYHQKKGSDIKTIIAQRKAELELMKEAGIPLLRGTMMAEVAAKAEPATAAAMPTDTTDATVSDPNATDNQDNQDNGGMNNG